MSKLHSTLQRSLNVDAAARTLVAWSDKVCASEPRNWDVLSPESQQLYRLLVLQLVDQLVSSDALELHHAATDARVAALHVPLPSTCSAA